MALAGWHRPVLGGYADTECPYILVASYILADMAPLGTPGGRKKKRIASEPARADSPQADHEAMAATAASSTPPAAPQEGTLAARCGMYCMLSAHQIANYISRLAVPYLVPFIVMDFSFTEPQRALLLGCFTPGYILTQIPSGWFAARCDHTRTHAHCKPQGAANRAMRVACARLACARVYVLLC